MNRALWKRAIAESWLLLLACSLLLVLFSWLFVWLMSRFTTWGGLLQFLPDFVRPMLGAPLAELAKPVGQISVLYVHVVTLLVCIGWAIGQGSDVVSGEIDRGTMEHLLTLPVWRSTVLLVPAVVATLGAAVLAVSVWVGTWLGLKTVHFPTPIAWLQFLPGTVNLFAMTFCLTGMTALFSSCDHDRWRTIKLSSGLFVASFIVKMVSRMWPAGAWLRFLTFLGAFEPQRLILEPGEAWRLSLWYDGTLALLGLACFGTAALILMYRDIPVSR